jgi:hypothetical protein
MATGVTGNDIRTQTRPNRARYRVNEHGTHVVIVPTRCPSGRHQLAVSGYRIIEASDTLTVSCHRCTEMSHPDHSWILATGGRQAQSAEFDDAQYTDLLRATTQ